MSLRNDMRSLAWWKKWLVRQAIYSACVWPVVSLLYFPYNEWVVGLSEKQWVRWLEFGIPQSLLANLVIGPFTKAVWSWNWRREHPT